MFALCVWPSVTAALFNNHLLVMPQGQIVVFEVQHGERTEARRHAGRAGPSLRVVMSQEALKKTWMNHPMEKNYIKCEIDQDSWAFKHQVIILPACTRGWWVGRTRPEESDSLPHSGMRCSVLGGWSTRPSRWARSPPTCPPCGTAAAGAALLPVQRWMNLRQSPSSSPPCSFCGVGCDCHCWLCPWSRTWSSPLYGWGCMLHGLSGADCFWRRWSSWPGSWLRDVFFFASIPYSWRETLFHLQRRSQAPCQALLRPPVVTLRLPGTANISTGLSR